MIALCHSDQFEKPTPYARVSLRLEVIDQFGTVLRYNGCQEVETIFLSLRVMLVHHCHGSFDDGFHDHQCRRATGFRGGTHPLIDFYVASPHSSGDRAPPSGGGSEGSNPSGGADAKHLFTG